MFKVRKQFHVPIGHRLSKHCGLCKNVHGHNLMIEVQLKSEVLNVDDMVVDFSYLKKKVNDLFLDKMDHCTILNENDRKTREGIEKVQDTGKIILCPSDPTAEFLSKSLYDMLKENLKDMTTIKVDYVRIWESDSACAEYSED